MRTSKAAEYVVIIIHRFPLGKLQFSCDAYSKAGLDRTSLKHLINFFLSPSYQDKVQCSAKGE